MTPPRPKILILGLDGMTFDVIRPLVRAGSLPGLARMMEEGTQADLKSTVMPNSYPSWTSMTTGVNPGRHGIFWSLVRPEARSYQLRLMSSRDIGARRIWDDLGEQDFRVGVFNLPTEYPPSPVNGFLVCGALTPDMARPFTFPAGLRDEIFRVVPDYKCEIDYGRVGLDALPAELFHSMQNRERVLLHLIRNKPWDFLMAVFTESDLVQHKFWAGIDERHPRHREYRKKYGDVVHSVYRRLDETLQKILEAVPGDTFVFVVSDHGFGPFYQSFSVPVWLRDNGYLSSEGDPRRDLAKKTLASLGLWKPARALRERLRGVRLGFQGKGSVRDLRDRDAAAGRESFDRIRWDQTRAYFTPDYGIRLNLSGREPRGIVSPGEQERALADEIKRKLERLSFSNGEPVFEAVLKKEEAFHGPFVDRAPDLTVPINHAGAPSRPEKWPYALTHPTLTGTHTPLGIFLSRGPGIRKNHRLEEAQVLDVVPTVRHILGRPDSPKADGRILRGLFVLE